MGLERARRVLPSWRSWTAGLCWLELCRGTTPNFGPKVVSLLGLSQLLHLRWSVRRSALALFHLAALLEAPHELSHEHVLRAMLTFVQGSSVAKSEARSVQGLSSRLEERLREVGGREEGEESEEYCRQLLKELKLEEGVDR